jgi:hypothetical protein
MKTNTQDQILSIAIIIVLIIMPFFFAQGFSLQLTTTAEYNNYVHNVSGATGNYTYVEKPMFPVLVNNNTIPIGQNWTIVCPLEAGHNYHVYCYGTWVNTTAAAKTDYDIYVFNPQGDLESSHTEAAGFPEHLGTTVNDALFTPKYSGNYSFVIKNDPRESEGAQQATFMIMENLACDQWYNLYIEGANNNNSPSFHTSWAYEFVTNESKVQLYVKVPETLDMYEARLYLMNDANSLRINSFPLPWEPGLYGNLSGRLGGYNFETEAYRGVAYASCEYRGQSMFLNYTSTNAGANLYHLVFIGEEGSGNIEFMLKSQFANISLIPLIAPTRAYPDNPADISYMTKNASLEKAQLFYTTNNNWTSESTVNMIISNQTCNATIPGQEAGTLVQYRINATDVLKNNMTARGNYTVKTQPTLNITAVKDTIQLGNNITITGLLTPNSNDSLIEVQIASFNSTQTEEVPVLNNGTFVASLKPRSSGLWAVSATSKETNSSYRCDSEELAITVTEPPIYVRYSFVIIAGIVAASAISGAVYFFKFRKR